MNVFLGSTNPSSYKIEAGTLDHLLTKTYQASHLRVENLHFKGANKDAVHITGGSNINFDQVDIENSGENGLVALSVLQLVIENSKVKDSFNNGLNLRYGNTGAIIRGNTIENSAVFPGTNQNADGTGIGIFATQDNTVIENNIVRNTGYNGIFFGGNNSTVKNNLIDTFCINKSDGGGIYTFDISSTTHYKNRKITGNIILNAVGSWGGVDSKSVNFKPLANGIFLDDNSSGIEITGNTVAGAANAAINMSNVSDIIIRDNTFYNGYSQLAMANNNLGRDLRKVTVERNILFSKTDDQYAYRIQSIKNDIPQMLSADQNYFFRPMGDGRNIYYRQEESGKIVERTIDREKWTAAFGKDKNSKSFEVGLEKFKMKKTLGNNIFTNGGFDANIKGITVFEGGTGTWESNKINGGTLKVDAPKTSSSVINVGAVKKGKRYLLRFKSLANKKGTVTAYLRYRGTPWENVSPTITFALSTGVSEFQTVLSPILDVEDAVLRLVTDDPGLIYWIDDLEFVEAEVEMTDPNKQILFEYNASHSPKTVKLIGTYVDAKNTTFSGSATIPPFGSLVLVKVSDGGQKVATATPPTPAVDGLYFNTTSPGPLTFGGQAFAALDAKHLVTTGSVGSNPKGSQEALFQKERFGKSLKYAIPVPNGTYTVQTYHVETYFGRGTVPQKAGQRVFDISLEGKVVKDDFDLFVHNGNKEAVLTFPNVEVKDGILNLDMAASANNVTVSGIAILKK